MDFKEVFKSVSSRFREKNIDFALIGAFALLRCGIERATKDIDFIVYKSDSGKIEKIMNDLTYETIQLNEMFAQYESPLKAFGNVDFLHVGSESGKRILNDAFTENVLGEDIRIIRPEDLVGLKVLAYANNPEREERDKADIRQIFEVYKRGNIDLDIDKIKKYYSVFEKINDFHKLWGGKE